MKKDMKSVRRIAGLQSFREFYQSLKAARHADYQGRVNAKVRGPEAFECQKCHLLGLYKDVRAIHSFQDAGGQIFDCMPINEQPALLRSGHTLARPPNLRSLNALASTQSVDYAPLNSARKDGHGNIMACPQGCVAIRRVTLDELTRFETLSHFLRKGPRHPDRKKPLVLPDTPSAANEAHEYAHAFQQVPNLGGHSFVNIWDPAVPPEATFSLSQQWYVANSPRGVQTAEVGWQVYPQKYGHSKPVLFSYWTADGYQSTGSYSNDGHDFVQYSSTAPLGFALDHVSIAGGAQAELEVTYMLSGGNWWLFIGGSDASHAVGYYPGSLYAQGPMATGATEIDFGGETCSSGKFPPMGSGNFASGGYRQAAYHRNIYYFDAASVLRTADLTIVQQWPASYSIELQNAPDWGEFFYFGGPGGS